MRGTIFSFLLAIMWPSLQAVFTVESEQDSYNGELHRDVRIGCRFSKVESVSHLSVIWLRTQPQPKKEVYRLEKGLESNNFTDKVFRKRARLLKDELKNFRAVLELSQLKINDTGTYQCIIRQEEVDYKETTLTVQAPYTSVEKSIRQLDNEEVELSCESQGFPMAQVVWSGSTLTEQQKSNSSSEMTSEGIFRVKSQVIVKADVNNYTCTYVTEGKVQQTATFKIPGEIPGRTKWSHVFVAIGVIGMMCLGFAVTSLIVHRRKKGQARRESTSTTCVTPDPHPTVTSTDALLPKMADHKADTFAFTSEVCEGKADNLREVLRQRYAELSKAEKSGFLLHHSLFCREKQCQDIQAVIPQRGETVLLEGKEGSGKSSLARKLAFSWADGSDSDPWLVILVDVNGAAGDFFKVVKSRISNEARLETSDVRKFLLGDTDSLLILDGYKEGNREMDKSLIEFLKDRSTCRVLITAQPGQHSILEGTITKSLQLHTQPAQT